MARHGGGGGGGGWGGGPGGGEGATNVFLFFPFLKRKTKAM
jgi:hypothetical protein